MRRPGAAVLLVSASLLTLAVAPSGPPPLPERMADTGGGTQLITAQASRTSSTTGTVTWWDRRDGRWVKTGSAAARFGANGLVEGGSRKQGTNTTPTGLYDLPYAFGIKKAPDGTEVTYRPVRQNSWWCQDNDSRSYNRWTEPRPADCRAARSEHLVSYTKQYAHAYVIGFNYAKPVRGRGAGIFLHVNGRGRRPVVCRCRRWRCGRSSPGPIRSAWPHIAIGTASGATAITRY